MVSFGVVIIIVQHFSVHNTYIRIINNSALPNDIMNEGTMNDYRHQATT
jgi:hypothetical protein